MCGHFSLYNNLVHIDVCSLLALHLLLQWLWVSVNWNICLHFCAIGVLLGTSHPVLGTQEHSHQWSFCRHYCICQCFLLCTYTRWIPDGLWRPGNSQSLSYTSSFTSLAPTSIRSKMIQGFLSMPCLLHLSIRCCMDGHGSFGQLVATMAVQMLPWHALN